MPNSFLTNKNLEFILFGGKGGSGKTTSATAAALYLAQITKKKILIVSTDPAPSIGDSLDIDVGNKITQIRDNLWALEMDAKKLAEEFRKKNSETMKTLVERGTYLSREDIELFENLTVPGMDEVMAVIKIADLLKIHPHTNSPASLSLQRGEPAGGGVGARKYDLIILDTAPTGHTKVLLSLPEKMERWIAAMNLMQEKHRFLKRHWAGKYVEDECDKFLEETKTDVTEVKNLLENPELTEFVPVTIPEPMSILETEDLIEYLNRLGINAKSIIANRILFSGECDFCKKRAEIQEKYVGMINKKFKKFQILKMPLFPSEIRGEKDLLDYAGVLFGEKEYQPVLSKKIFRPKFAALPKGQMTEFLKKDLNFIICGGKGGVGKTVIAAATAIALAEKQKDKKILITTTDPAHALSNVFEQDIPLSVSAKEISITGFNNLFALEIDTQKMLKKWQNEYRKDVTTAFEEFVGTRTEVVFDKKVLEELMELSPPGLEELMALGKIMDLMKEGQYDIYILDSAASGHLLRFLELPEMVGSWLKSIFKILLKYKNIAGLVEIKRKLLDLSHDIKGIQEKLFGAERTEFLMISIAEEMGIRQMGDLGQSLEKLNIFYHYIILNQILSVSPCKFCLAKRENQEKYISRVEREYPKKEIVLVPLFSHDIRGIRSLQELSNFIFG